MKSSNKTRIEKLIKSSFQQHHSCRKIIFDPNTPRPHVKGFGPFLFLPDNEHRFPHLGLKNFPESSQKNNKLF